MRAFGKMRGHTSFKQFKQCKKAGYSYMGIKIIMALLTFYFIPCQNCPTIKSILLRNTLHIVLIGHFITIGLSFAISLITVSSIIKIGFFIANFFMSADLFLPIPYMKTFQLMNSSNVHNFALLVKASLCCLIFYMMTNALKEVKRIKEEKKNNG